MLFDPWMLNPVIVRRCGIILLESAPNGVDLEDVKHDLEKVGHIQAPVID